MDFSDIVQQPDQPKPYWQTLDEYRRARASDPTIASMSLPQYASGINQLVGQPEHQDNIQDSSLRHAGANIDIAMHHFGGAEPGTWPQGWPTLSSAFGGPREGVDLPGMAHAGAANVATSLGASPGVGEAVGKGAEQAVGSIPVAAAGLLPGVGIPAMAGMAGLQTYGETGSKLQAGVSATGAALIPKFMEGFGQAALRAVGAKTLGELSPELAALEPKGSPKLDQFKPSNLVQRGVELGAKQVGLTANMLGTGALETGVDPNLTWDQKLRTIGSEFSPSNLVSTVVGQLPFAAMDLISPHPVETATREVEGDFADRFSTAYQKDTGQAPTADQVQATIDRLKTGKVIAPESKTGQVLASIGQAPVQVDLKTPIHTTEGAWNPVEAIETTRMKTNRMLVAQGEADPDNPPITSAHDPVISFVLKTIDAKTLNKDELSDLAASKMSDMWVGDRSSLTQTGYVPDATEFPAYGQGTKPETRNVSYQLQSADEEKIAALTDPNSKYYNQEIAQRIALVSGDQEHWLQAGIPEGLTKQVWQAVQSAASEVAPELQVTKEVSTEKPMLTNIINLVSGLGPKRSERIAAIERQIQDEIAKNGIFIDPSQGKGGFMQDRLETLYGELQALGSTAPRVFNAPMGETGSPILTRTGLDTGRANVGAPLGDSTFAARRRAMLYDKPLDINNPKTAATLPQRIADFVRDISATIRQAEKNFDRRALGEPAVKDADGKPIRFTTKDQAEEWANDANSQLTGTDQFNLKYVVPALPETDGSYRVLEKRLASLFGTSTARDFERTTQAGEQTFEERLAAGTEEETTEKPLSEEGVLPEGMTLDDLGDEMFSKRFAELSKEQDPAKVEGRKQALVKNFADFMLAVPDTAFRQVWKLATGARVRDVANWKQKFIRYVQFLGYGGDVNVKQENGRLNGVGDLDALNKFMGELGYGTYKPPHKQAGKSRASEFNHVDAGTNFFEKFALISKLASGFMVNPRDLLPDPEHRPLGDYGWMTPQFRRDFDKKVSVDWPDLPKQKATHFRPGVLNRDGSEFRSDLAGIDEKTGTIKVNTGQPLADMMISSTKHDLVIKANDVVKWFKQLGGVDTTMAEELMRKLPFVANQNIGFSVTKDPLNRGYFHALGGVESAGILIDPYQYTKEGKLAVMHPRDVFPHLMEELGHSAVDFAWSTDKAFNADVQRAYDYVKSHLDAMVGVGADGGKFAQLGLTSLRNPREMLAGMFSDPNLHQFLRGIDDPESYYQTGVQRSFFDKLFNMIKNLFNKMVGPVGAKTMLDRVAGLSARAVEIESGMSLINRGDIFQELYDRGLLAEHGMLEGQKPQPVPKAQEPTQVYPPWTPRDISQPVPGPTGQIDPKAAYLWEAVLRAQKTIQQSDWTKVGVEAKRDAEQNLATVKELYRQYQEGQSTGIEPKPGYKPTYQPGEYKIVTGGKLPNDIEPVRTMLERDVAQEQTNLQTAHSLQDSAYAGVGAADVPTAESRLKYAQDRLDRYNQGQLDVKEIVDSTAVKDMESKLADLKAQLQATNNLHIAATNEVEVQQRVTSERLAGEIQSTEKVLEELKKIAELPEGQVLESRTDPSKVIDAMKAASVYLTEDNNGDLWFKPYSVDTFRKIFGPAFGDKLRLTDVGGQWGYSIRPSEAFNLTQADVARMPTPRVKPWAPSIFETMKSLFKQQGANDATAEALAGYQTQFAALLRNTDRAIWGILPDKTRGEDTVLGEAWGYWKKAGIAKTALDYVPEDTIRHESAHLAGFHDAYEQETPDVKAAVDGVNSVFESLSQEDKAALLDTIKQTTDADQRKKSSFDEVALTQPREFAAQFMGHIGDVMADVPKPSAYLREVMRFLPDNLSRLLQLNSMRKTQGLDRLQYLMENNARNRGIKDNLFPVIKDMAGIFKDMSRSALEIAEDQSEFYRTRSVYPDIYKALLEAHAKSLENFQDITETGAPSLKSTLLESRLPPTIENFVRKVFNLPTSDGNLPTKLSIWDKNLMQFAQFALKYPSARSFFDAFTKSDSMRNTFRRNSQVALAGAFEGNRLLDDVRTKHVADFYESVPMRSKFSKIALELNVLGDFKYEQEKKAAGGDEMAMDPTKVTDWITPQYLNSLMTKHGVTDAERPAMQTVFDGLRNQYTYLNTAISGSHMHELTTMLARGVARNTNLMPEGARSVTQLLIDGVQKLATDLEGAAQSLAQFRQAVPDPAVYQRLLAAAQSGWQGIQRLERAMAMRSPYYFSEIRPGKFGLIWQDAQGKTTNRYFASEADRNRYVTNNKINPIRQTNPDSGIGISPNILSIIDEIHQQTVDRAKNLFGENEAQQLGRLADFSTDLRDQLNNNDILRESLGRKLQPGRDELDMFDTTQHYLNAVSNAIKNRFISREKELLFTSPEFNNEPEIKSFIEGQIQAALKPDTAAGSFMRNAGFLYYLWGNISSMIMQSSHQIMGLAPMLTRQGQSVAGSYNTILKANQAVIASKRGGYKDPVIRDMVARLQQEGGISSWISKEIDYNKDLSLINRIRGTSGKGLWQPFDLAKNKLYQGFDLLRRMYSIVPDYNSEVGFVAALMHLRSRPAEFGGPLSGEELYKEATFLRANTMYTGGKAGRPGFFQWMPRSAAQGLWSLQTYANGLTTEMGELIRRSFNPKGMTPAQTRQVRKAAAQMLITQTAVSGVLGLPFATLALTGLQKLFPEENIEGSVRNALAGLGGDDEAMGSFLSNAAVTGVPSAMDYSPDLGSRFALHGIFHVSPYGDVGWEQLLGPAGGILSNVLKASQAGLEGRPLEGVQDIMPVGLRRVYQSLEQGQTYKTQSGRVMTNDLGPGEIVARMIGFRPARVRRIEDFERLNKISESAEAAEQSAWTKQQVRLLASGQDDQVKQNVAQRTVDKKGVYPASKYANDVAKEYEESTTPVDLRKFGNRATVEAQRSLQGALGTQTEGPSNTERLQLQQQIAARLGLGGPTQSRWQHAAGLDQLMQRYPHLTTPQASLLLHHASGSQPTPDLYQELLTSGE